MDLRAALPINGVFAVASDAVSVVHDVGTCVMVDIVVVVTSRVVEIGVGSR